MGLLILYPLTSVAQTVQDEDEESVNRVLGPDGQEITDAECEALEGANAPIERLARLDGAMSVRNLELTYFGKPPHALTAKDFELLKILRPFCEETPSEVDEVIFDKLAEKIDEAMDTRDATVQWMDETKTRLDGLETSPEAVREVHNAWTDMMSRSQEMLAADQRYFADYLTKKRDALYAGKPKQTRTLVSPFYPGPTIPPGQKE